MSTGASWPSQEASSSEASHNPSADPFSGQRPPGVSFHTRGQEVTAGVWAETATMAVAAGWLRRLTCHLAGVRHTCHQRHRRSTSAQCTGSTLHRQHGRCTARHRASLFSGRRRAGLGRNWAAAPPAAGPAALPYSSNQCWQTLN